MKSAVQTLFASTAIRQNMIACEKQMALMSRLARRGHGAQTHSTSCAQLPLVHLALYEELVLFVLHSWNGAGPQTGRRQIIGQLIDPNNNMGHSCLWEKAPRSRVGSAVGAAGLWHLSEALFTCHRKSVLRCRPGCTFKMFPICFLLFVPAELCHAE